VATAGLAFFWAMVLAIFVREFLVQWVAASDFGAFLFELQFGCVRCRHDILVLIERSCGCRGRCGVLVVVSDFIRAVQGKQTRLPTVILGVWSCCTQHSGGTECS
jgi:hypothetical protein